MFRAPSFGRARLGAILSVQGFLGTDVVADVTSFGRRVLWARMFWAYPFERYGWATKVLGAVI